MIEGGHALGDLRTIAAAAGFRAELYAEELRIANPKEFWNTRFYCRPRARPRGRGRAAAVPRGRVRGRAAVARCVAVDVVVFSSCMHEAAKGVVWLQPTQ